MSASWMPQPKQKIFMERPEYEVLFGGAAGGGKSDSMLAEALRQINIPNYRGIIFRDTVPQLEGLITRSYDLYGNLKGQRPKFNENKKRWQFESGAKIFFGYMQRDSDRFNYQGKAYDFIGFDELTHFSLTQYQYMMSRNRPMGPGTRVYMRATANPDGKGMAWVKQRFVTPAPPNTRIVERYSVLNPQGEKIQLSRDRIYIPATVFDNKKLLENDPDYLANLAALPEAERNALMYGSWDSFSGQVFTEFRDDPNHYKDRMWTHVIEPFQIPDHWKIYRGFDFGYAKPYSVGWYAVDTKGKIYRIAELYGWNGIANQGLKEHPVEQARKIREVEENNPLLKGKRIIGVADPAIFDESRGESVARMMERSPNFVYFHGGDHVRLPGKMQYHYRFAFDEMGDCMFQIFNTCRNFIRTIPNLTYSETIPEDIDTTEEDHIYDECRYVLMEHPIAPRGNVLQKKPAFDPLDMFKEQKRSQGVQILNI